MNEILICRRRFPCGELLLGSWRGALCLCDWAAAFPRRDFVIRRLERALRAKCAEREDAAVAREAARQLDEYFARRRTRFDVPVLTLGTDFQKKVWDALLKIPFGETVSYAELAREIGSPKAVRAAAGAIRANAVCIFVPCHRVIGADGSLTGFGGGLEAKRLLLALEGAGTGAPATLAGTPSARVRGGNAFP